MTAIVVLAVVALVFAAVIRWGADSRTGDDWRPPVEANDLIGGPLR